MSQTVASHTVSLAARAESLSLSGLMRNYATPLVGTLMLIVGGSGALMFFHLTNGGLKGLHEWLGLGLLAVVALHLVRNWRALSNLLAAPRSQVMLGASCLAVAIYLSFVPAGPVGNPARAMMMAAERAPLSQLAPVLGVEPDMLVARLAEAGIPARTDQSVEEIARAAHRDSPHLIGLLAASAAPVSARHKL